MFTGFVMKKTLQTLVLEVTNLKSLHNNLTIGGEITIGGDIRVS